jgi:hypothetical protein
LENVAREYHENSGLWQYQVNVNIFGELSVSGEAFQFARIVSVSPRLIDPFGDLRRYEQNHVVSLDAVPSDILPLNTLRFAIIAIEDEALLYGYDLKKSPYFLGVQKKLAQQIKDSKDIKYKLEKNYGTLRDITLCTSNGEPFAVNDDNFCVFTKFYPYNPSFRKKISLQTLKALQSYAYTTKYIRNVNRDALRK